MLEQVALTHRKPDTCVEGYAMSMQDDAIMWRLKTPFRRNREMA